MSMHYELVRVSFIRQHVENLIDAHTVTPPPLRALLLLFSYAWHPRNIIAMMTSHDGISLAIGVRSRT